MARTIVAGGFDNEAKVILDTIKNYSHQTILLAEKLSVSAESDTKEFTAVWEYVKKTYNIKESFPKFQEIRTPKRAYADRNKGISYVDVVILAACILIEMKYKPFLWFTAFGNQKIYSHVFVGVIHENELFIINPAMDEFNKLPPNMNEHQLKIDCKTGLPL